MRSQQKSSRVFQLLVVLGVVVLAAPARSAEPIEKGERAKADPQVNALLEPIRQKHDLPALAGAIVTGEKLIAIGAVGVRKVGDKTKVTVHDKFHIGSCTKAMTATLLAMFVEEGKLTWDTTLEQALPDLASVMHPDYRKVTIEQMLAHRSGFTGETFPRGGAAGSVGLTVGTQRSRREVYVKLILAEPLSHAPGTEFEYSNRNFIVAGLIAERLANQDWESQMRKRLFDPLKMASVGFGAPGHAGKVDEPWPHLIQDGRKIPVDPGTPASDNPVWLGPAGRVHASLADWGKFVAAHLRGENEGPNILKPETFRRLHTAYPGSGNEYGFGWGITERNWGGKPVLTHSGSNTMNYAVVWAAPRKDFAVLAVTNVGNDEAAKACDEVASALIGYYQSPP